VILVTFGERSLPALTGFDDLQKASGSIGFAGKSVSLNLRNSTILNDEDTEE